MFNQNRNIDIDPNYYQYQGMQQPYPQKPRIMDAFTYWFSVGIKVSVTLWLITTIYGILLTEGDSWNQKALNYFEHQRVQYQQQLQKIQQQASEEQNSSKSSSGGLKNGNG